MKYPAKNPAKFLKPEPEPDSEAGFPAGSGFSRISGRFLASASVIKSKLKKILLDEQKSGCELTWS